MAEIALRRAALAALLAALSALSTAEDLVESLPQAAWRARVAIIIDDLGYSLRPAQRVIAIPQALTLAIIPHTPYGARIAHLAHTAAREVMLHTPMETLAERPWEQQALRQSMDEAEFIATFDKMLHAVPHVSGINNHGGSLLTQDRERMAWLMTRLSRQRLYFIDSRTTAGSQAQAAAREAQVNTDARDVFLDNERQVDSIAAQLAKLRRFALDRGEAIAIGHPYPETLSALEVFLPQLESEGIAVVPVSALRCCPRETSPQAPQTAHHRE